MKIGPIYLDHNATTPLDPRVFEAMRPYFIEQFGNPASAHSFALHPSDAVAKAKRQVAEYLHSDPDCIVFTSGATESNNLALKGVAEARGKKSHIITQRTEHKCIIEAAKTLERQGHEITWLDVDDTGRVHVEEVKAKLRHDTALVSIMWANNEIGTIQPIREIAQLCRQAGVLFHTDATQAIGKIPINVHTDFIDLLSLSGHKFYGPKGTGVLYVREGVKVSPQVDGGGQQNGMRSGTLNVPGIVGLGAAIELVGKEMHDEVPRLRDLRDRLEWGIRANVHDTIINGHSTLRLPHVTNICFPGIESPELIRSLKTIAASSGSACSTGSTEPSYVLRACGMPRERAVCSLRFSLGKLNNDQQIDRAIEIVVETVSKIRGRASLVYS